MLNLLTTPDERRYENIMEDGVPDRVLTSRCFAAVNRGVNATIVALYDPQQVRF